MNCIIVEDQAPAQRILKKYIEDIGSLQLLGVFPDVIQAIDFLSKETVDLIFLDIHLPKLSGIEFLKTVPNPPSVILTTAFSEYALESYELNVVDYLLKPFSFPRFVKAVSKITGKKHFESDKGKVSEKQEIFIKSGYEHIKVQINEIQWITSSSDYSEIITNDKKHLSSEPLHHWLEILPKDRFYRIHKSHIINTGMIEKIVGNQVYLNGGIKLPIGRAFKDGFMERVLK